MKQVPTWLLMSTLCLLFLAFALGFYLGQRGTAGELRVAVVRKDASREERFQGVTEQPTGESSSSNAQNSPEKLLNLNEATKEELESLPGIGRVLAQRILDYREVYGDFLALEELTNVEGIGEGKLEEIRDLITVEEAQ